MDTYDDIIQWFIAGRNDNEPSTLTDMTAMVDVV
jgi:hypothetical protein